MRRHCFVTEKVTNKSCSVEQDFSRPRLGIAHCCVRYACGRQATYTKAAQAALVLLTCPQHSNHASRTDIDRENRIKTIIGCASEAQKPLAAVCRCTVLICLGRWCPYKDSSPWSAHVRDYGVVVANVDEGGLSAKWKSEANEWKQQGHHR